MTRRSIALLLFALLLPSAHGIAAPKPKLMWFDATANFRRFSYPDSIRSYLDTLRRLGFTDAVVDVKPITGEVLFPCTAAPRMTEWNGFTRPDFDYLGTFIEEGHRRGLRVHASLNVFVAGHNFHDRGIVYSAHPEWATVVHTDSGIMPITRVKTKYSAMTNPADPAVRAHELAVLAALVRRYPRLDGVILDRVRYDGIAADFSPLSRSLFERYIGAAVPRFPGDVLEWSKDSSGKAVTVPGPFYRRWLEWRAGVIHSFIAEARAAVKGANPRISFGDYTGAWYPLYYEMGVNWASRRYDPSLEYPWATERYREYGYAELLDLYTTGNYFFEVTKEELARKNSAAVTESGSGGPKEAWYSVEGSAEMAMRVTMRAVPVFGGLYVEQYAGHPEQFAAAVAMNLKKTDGLMVFDIVHLIERRWWEPLARGIRMGESP